VYRAHDPVIDRPVALKTVILPESLSDTEREAFLNRFFHEARTAGKLIHSNIVVTYDASVDDATGTPFIAMEFIDGGSLGERLRRGGVNRLGARPGLGRVHRAGARLCPPGRRRPS
jgi:serine/threonine-protein kinase